jgi:hypothetical protein
MNDLVENFTPIRARPESRDLLRLAMSALQSMNNGTLGVKDETKKKGPFRLIRT